MKPPKPEPGCTDCYWDDYVDKWRYVSTCSVHGENKYPKPDYRFGGRNCKCTRTGPENTYEVSERCPLHSGQDFTSEAPPVAVPNKDAAPAAYDPPPGHYSTGAGIDPWAVWDAFGLDKDAYLANAVKYILRAGKKDIAPRLDDLIKARNYINKAIEKERSNDGTPAKG